MPGLQIAMPREPDKGGRLAALTLDQVWGPPEADGCSQLRMTLAVSHVSDRLVRAVTVPFFCGQGRVDAVV